MSRLAVGPEHPRYIPIPVSPQQTVPDRAPIKGVLPVPRNVFAGTDKTKSDDDFIAQATQNSRRTRTPPKGSREEWKAKMSEIRKENLREGVKSLRARQQVEQRRVSERSRVNQEKREELLHRPEREDERLTAPSNNLDLDSLFGKNIPDPTREERLLRKKENVEKAAREKKEERMDALHTLYMNAREFIVTPQQLDAAVDKAFGTPEDPAKFLDSFGPYDFVPNARSVWAQGRPSRVQDLLNRATGQRPTRAMQSAGVNTAELSKDRMRRIAETLTGGKM